MIRRCSTGSRSQLSQFDFLQASYSIVSSNCSPFQLVILTSLRLSFPAYLRLTATNLPPRAEHLTFPQQTPRLRKNARPISALPREARPMISLPWTQKCGPRAGSGGKMRKLHLNASNKCAPCFAIPATYDFRARPSFFGGGPRGWATLFSRSFILPRPPPTSLPSLFSGSRRRVIARLPFSRARTDETFLGDYYCRRPPAHLPAEID